jgi:hypothetical protein
MRLNLFSPWYFWKIAELALSNNHSLTHSFNESPLTTPISLHILSVFFRFSLWTIWQRSEFFLSLKSSESPEMFIWRYVTMSCKVFLSILDLFLSLFRPLVLLLYNNELDEVQYMISCKSISCTSITSKVVRSPPCLGWPLWNICVTNDQGYLPFIVNTSRTFMTYHRVCN